MNLLSLTKPKVLKKRNTTNTLNTLNKVCNLDSGDIIKYDVTDVTDVDDVTDVTDVIINFGIYSYCYKYIELIKQYNNLIKISPEHALKFSTELDSLKFHQSIDYYKKQLEHLQIYDKISISFDLEYTVEIGTDILHIDTDLYVKDDILIIPDIYDYIADDLVKIIETKNIKYIQIFNKEKRLVRPTHKFKIFFENKLHCPNCLFRTNCKGK